jgi:hypothetical protein
MDRDQRPSARTPDQIGELVTWAVAEAHVIDDQTSDLAGRFIGTRATNRPHRSTSKTRQRQLRRRSDPARTRSASMSERMD